MITLVCGPPCAGKTTYVQRAARPGDLVLDLDTLAQQAGSPRRHQHAAHHVQAAEQVMRRHLRALHHGHRHGRDVWIIRCLPDPRQRTALASMLNARIHMLLPTPATCLRRSRTDRRPRGTDAAIRWWYRAYRPADIDHLADLNRPSTCDTEINSVHPTVRT